MTSLQDSTLRDLFTPSSAQAEAILLELADYIYANTSLKPMSKTLFAISRLLLVVVEKGAASGTVGSDPEDLVRIYKQAQTQLRAPLTDDYSFADVVEQSRHALPRILSDLRTVARLATDGDTLGLIFNTLVRGKWDSGEGLGTFLTPQEVVDAVVEMVLTRNEAIDRNGPTDWLAGDICGGTGRFPFALARELVRRGTQAGALQDRLFSFDQSSLATDYARLNFHFLRLHARCDTVADSLVADAVTALRDRCAALATNPPFGAAKYEITPALGKALRPEIIRRLVNGSTGGTVDPAGLFLFRNLDLLRLGGVLGIVLPDGVVQSPSLAAAMAEYEQVTGVAVEVRALVSLPSITFAFGGTVAKTSFLIISKEPKAGSLPMFVREARHIGFLKKANKRIPDPRGNELPEIVDAYRGLGTNGGTDVAPNWRHWARLGIQLSQPARPQLHGKALCKYGDAVRDFTVVEPGSPDDLHISVLDVDETGLIDVLASSRNRPSSRVIACQPGDVLVSCINPRIWRVTVVPDLPGRWSCSPEFLVLRPKSSVDPWGLALALHHAGFKAAVQGMAGGTSSSRQRVDKEEVLKTIVPEVSLSSKAVTAHKNARESFYKMRLVDGHTYAALHEGRDEFQA